MFDSKDDGDYEFEKESKDPKSNQLKFLKSIIDLKPSLSTMNLILDELKKLLKSNNIQSKICACKLIKKLKLFQKIDEKTFSLLQENDFIQLLLQTLKNKNVNLQWEICSVFPPLIPMMIKKGMNESVELISSNEYLKKIFQ
jgi:hypothetical protein